MRNFKGLACSIFALVLAACGGGGGGASSTPVVVADPNMTVPIQTAVANLVNNGFSKNFTATGWVNNSTLANPIPNTPIAGSGTLTVGPPTAVTFTSGPLTGTAALQSVAIITGTAPSTATTYYNPSNYTILATYDGTNTIYYSPYNYPSTVKAGDTGPLGSGTTGGFLPTTTTSQYSVASDTASSLLVTLMSTENIDSGVAGTVQSQTVYRITTSGAISLVSENVQQSGGGSVYQSLTFTF